MKNNERLYLDVHVIQTVPPSNINRDDTGSPKTCMYGGVRRSRVSSQSWKHSIREYFHDHGDASNVGLRTLEIVRYVADRIQEMDESIDREQAMKMAETVLKDAGVKTKDQKARALFFLGDIQARGLAKAAIDKVQDKKQLTEILKNNPSIDIALFGRMVAEDPTLNEDASCQVAHGISTHAVQTEYDFYTAIDDFSSAENAGAGMLGTIEYNSSTLYRYANVAVHELMNQLGETEAVTNTLKLFVEAFCKSMPTGKINSFANQTLPQALVVTLRQDRPVNLVGAFEEPIRSSEGYVEKSIEGLFNEFKEVEKFTDKPLETLFVISGEKEYQEFGKAMDSMSALLNEMGNAIQSHLED